MTDQNNVELAEPLGCFQVLAERKYMPSAKGYANLRGTFHSLMLAQSFARRLLENRDYYTGYEWAQVADVVTGEMWDYDDESGEWVKSQWIAQVGAL